MHRALPAMVHSRCGELVVAPDTRGTSAPHFHLTHAIGVNRSGGGKLFALGRTWRFDASCVVATNPYDPHWGIPGPERLDYYLFYPDPRWLASLPFAGGSSGTFRFSRAVLPNAALAGRLRLAFDRLVESSGEDVPARALNELFAAYAKLECKTQSHQRVLDKLDEDATARIAEWARSSGLSRAHYSREYQRAVGLSPLNHRRQTRVLAARNMIERGASLADAAAEAGFSDQAHMTRQFRQILGLTPKTFARRR